MPQVNGRSMASLLKILGGGLGVLATVRLTLPVGVGLLPILLSPTQSPAQVPSAPPHLRITVTSAADGAVQPDAGLTLREAIDLANGSLSVEALSAAEQQQVTLLSGQAYSEIRFNLPAAQTTIALVEPLPPLVSPGLVVDGTSQPGYGAVRSATPEIPTPAVTLKPADGAEVFRGLTITGNRVMVRGLSIYGFSASPRSTQTTPPADIFISNAPPPADASPLIPPLDFFAYEHPEQAPQDVVVELNWLGLPPEGGLPDQRSTFGVSVFNSVNATIRKNRIENHEGSGIITAVRSHLLKITDNVVLGNGVAGMPDAIRLEGDITDAEVTGNLLCGNDGSGIYLFKPEGSVRIQANDIRFNGRRLYRAAVYLMGSNHQVLDNVIGYQPGPGVAIAAYPQSERNLIRNNQFAALDGLSIDLNTQDNTSIQDYQVGDGPNPPRNSHFRRVETANGAINAPEFSSYTFTASGGKVMLTGKADPGTEVDIYDVTEDDGLYSPLKAPLMTVKASEDGYFEAEVEVGVGRWVSAIATDPQYGTSEPSPVVLAQADNQSPPVRTRPAYLAQCLVETPPTPPTPPAPEPLRLRVPRNIHFALDRSNLSAESRTILDQIAAVLLQYPFITVEMQGHTDPRASVAYNQALGERRARAARDYLRQKGIAPERLRIISYGESNRIATGSGRVDYARDRRVEFIFTDTRGLDIIFEDQERDLQIERP